MPAGDLRFEIIVDDQGTPRIQKFERVAKDADKKIKDSGKKRSKETADAWENAHRKMNNSVNRWKSVALGAFAAVGGYMIFRKMWKFSKESTEAFGVQEQAEKDLADQMKILNDYTDEAFESHLRFASAQQKVTKYGDEVTLAMMKNLKTYRISNDELQKASRLTMDLASAKKIDLRTASELVGKAAEGETGTLSRYGIIIDQNIPRSQKFAEVLRIIEERFGGAAQAEVDTYTGKVAQLTNAWGDLKEKIGSAFIPALSDLTENLKSMVEKGDEWIGVNQEIMQSKVIEWAGWGAKAVGFLAKMVLSLRGAWQLANLAFNRMAQKTVEGLRWLSDKLGGFLAIAGLVDPTAAKAALKLADLRDECKDLGVAFKDQGDEWSSAADRSSKAIDTLDKWIDQLFKSAKDLRKEGDGLANTFDNNLTPSFTNFNKAAKETFDYLKDNKNMMGMLSDQTWKLTYMGTEHLTPSLYDIREHFRDLVETELTLYGVTMRQLMPAATTFSIKWPKAIDKAKNSLGNFKTAFGEVVTGMLRGIGEMLLHADSFGGMMKQLFGGLGKTISVDFLGGMVGAFKSGFGKAKDEGKGLFSALKGGFSSIMDFVKGDWVSAIIGAVSSIASAIWGLFSKPEWKKVREETLRDLGVEISESLAKKIAETSKDMDDRFGAIIYHLGEIIDEVGLTADNFDKFAHRAHDALVEVCNGVFTTEQAAKTLNETFPKLVKAAEEFGITMNRELIDIIIHSRQMGIEVKAVSEYIEKQLGTATDALKKMVAGFASGSQEEFDRLSRLTLAVFNEMAANGASMIEQFDALKDVIGMLAQKQEEMGLAGSEAFNQLKRFQNLVETNRELVESVAAVGDMLTALGNIGTLTEQSFADLTAQAMGGFDKLAEAGFTSQESLTMMVPTLKAIQQAHETYGFTIDENTQKLLDQAGALGLLESSDPAEIMSKGFEDVVKAIDKLTDALVGHSLLSALKQCSSEVDVFGGRLVKTFDPSQVEGFSDKMDAIRRKMQLIQAETDITRRGFRGLGDELGGGFFPGRKEHIISYQYGTPYVPRTGRAIVHEGEQIIPAGQNRAGGQQEIHLHIDKLVIKAGGINFETQLFKEISMASKDGRLKIHRAASDKEW